MDKFDYLIAIEEETLRLTRENNILLRHIVQKINDPSVEMNDFLRGVAENLAAYNTIQRRDGSNTRG